MRAPRLGAVHAQSKPRRTAARRIGCTGASVLGREGCDPAGKCGAGVSAQRFGKPRARLQGMRSPAGGRTSAGIPLRPQSFLRLSREPDMQIGYFVEQQYSPVPEEAIFKNGGFFGLPNEYFDPAVGAKLYHRYI